MKILVTGSQGFVGKNLVAELLNQEYEVLTFDRQDSIEKLDDLTQEAEFVVHLAGINRPNEVKDFYTGNMGLTETLVSLLKKNSNLAPILISSSAQASLDNDYGKSKLAGEEVLLQHSKDNESKVLIYRFQNLFGKWSKPNYNSVIATWCYNISRNIKLEINNPATQLNLTYIDDVVAEIINAIKGQPSMDNEGNYFVQETYQITLGQIHEMLIGFRNSRDNHFVANMGKGFESKLYSTYLSYLPEDGFSYPLKMNVDQRGSFTEFIKSDDRGQVSINVSKPGITKGEHWHHSKNEKFLVVSGEGVIRLRNLFDDKIIEYKVNGDSLKVVDIPPGYTHNISNTGSGDMVTVMWVNEPFDPENPDTFFLPVAK